MGLCTGRVYASWKQHQFVAGEYQLPILSSSVISDALYLEHLL